MVKIKGENKRNKKNTSKYKNIEKQEKYKADWSSLEDVHFTRENIIK